MKVRDRAVHGSPVLVWNSPMPVRERRGIASRRPRRARVYASLAALLLLSGACGRKPRVPAPRPVIPGYTETGIASWYGEPFHGRRSANGEIYDMNKLTAAHRTLPFETPVRVTNLANGREVDVRITDRGPFVDGRIIDLSRAAADEIHMILSGISKVRITVLASAEPVVYNVQVGAFRNRDLAERMRDKVERFGDAAIIEPEEASRLYRVVVGGRQTRSEAQRLIDQLSRSGITAVVTRVDGKRE